MEVSTKKPLVTIGVPLYNSEQIIRSALDSIVSQDYENLKIIISDNNSSDGTLAICREYEKKFSNIEVLTSSLDKNSTYNFEKLLSVAEGKYFMWACDDDYWKPNFVTEMVNVLESDESVVAANCPIGKIFKDNSKSVEDLVRNDLSSDSLFSRVLKCSRRDYGEVIYSLFRLDIIKDQRFPVWWWINRDTERGTVSPLLYYILGKGKVKCVGKEALYFRRSYILEDRIYKIPLIEFGRFISFFAYVLRIFNMAVENTLYFYKSTNSVFKTLMITPVVFYGMTVEILYPFTERFVRYFKKAIGLLSRSRS